jgi:predicted phage-related endonuclease
MGIDKESIIAKEFELATQKKTRRRVNLVRHPEYPYIGVHMDRVIVGEMEPLEIKNVGLDYYRNSKDKWGPSWTDQVPETYFCQTMHYLICQPAAKLCYLAALIGDSELRIYVIYRDEEIIERMIAAYRDFWHYVDKNIAPPFDMASPCALDAVKRMYPQTDGTALEMPIQGYELHARLVEARARASHAEKDADTARAGILDLMGNAAILRLRDGSGYVRNYHAAKEISFVKKGYIQLDYRKTVEKE